MATASYLKKGKSMKLFLSMLFSVCLYLNGAEIDLKLYENSFYSPNGEDGVLARIFSLLKPQAYFCVDCGASDGISNNLTLLLRNQGWKGVLFDKAYDIPSVNLHRESLTAENINDLFHKYGVPETFDLLTIDTGYNDFYLWNALDSRYTPSVVCIVYNAYLGPNDDKVVLYHPYYCGDDTVYFGASILCMAHLGKTKGYTLVYAEETGRHLFFIRSELIEKHQLQFKDAGDVYKIFRSPDYENGASGYRVDSKKRKYLSSNEVIRK
jgi:hypothetical protein